MLMLIGLAFIYADFFIGGTDILPDLFGYILLFIHIFRKWNYQKRYDSSVVVWVIAAAALNVISKAAWPFYLMNLIFMIMEALAQFRLVWLLYKEESESRDAGISNREQLMKTSLIAILVITICRLILSLITVLFYVILVIQFIVGIGIIWYLYKLLKQPLTSYNKE